MLVYFLSFPSGFKIKRSGGVVLLGQDMDQGGQGAAGFCLELGTGEKRKGILSGGYQQLPNSNLPLLGQCQCLECQLSFVWSQRSRCAGIAQ